jgi:hypothetical protein
MYKVLSAESCSDGDTLASISGSGSQSTSPIKKPLIFLQRVFLSSGKQGGGAAVLREGHGIVTRETCIPTSLNINILGKSSVLHLAFWCSSAAGAMPNSACH